LTNMAIVGQQQVTCSQCGLQSFHLELHPKHEKHDRKEDIESTTRGFKEVHLMTLEHKFQMLEMHLRQSSMERMLQYAKYNNNNNHKCLVLEHLADMIGESRHEQNTTNRGLAELQGKLQSLGAEVLKQTVESETVGTETKTETQATETHKHNRHLSSEPTEKAQHQWAHQPDDGKWYSNMTLAEQRDFDLGQVAGPILEEAWALKRKADNSTNRVIQEHFMTLYNAKLQEYEQIQ